MSSSSVFTASYSCIQNGWVGIGNISSDPLFISGPQGNYYLSQITAGQTAQSPCVNAGDPATSWLAGTTRSDCIQDQGIVDIGFHYAMASTTQPLITVNPTYLNFDSVMIGQAASQNLMIRNIGTGTLVISGALCSSPFSSNFNPGNNQVAPGDSLCLIVTFTPDSVTAYCDSLVIISNAGVVTIALTGAGIPIPSPHKQPVKYPMVDGKINLISYPNPFNPVTTINFTLPQAGQVNLTVYDINGCQVAELINGWREAGQHTVTFDGSNLASGIYLYRIQAGGFTAIQKMMLVK